MAVYSKIRSVKLIQAIIGGKPHQPVLVFNDGIDRIGKQPVFGSNRREIDMRRLRRCQVNNQQKEEASKIVVSKHM